MPESETGTTCDVTVKWHNTQFSIPMAADDTLESLKEVLMLRTRVAVENQKLLNIRSLDATKVVGDHTQIGRLKIAKYIILMGSNADEIEAMNTVISTDTPGDHEDAELTEAEKSTGGASPDLIHRPEVIKKLLWRQAHYTLEEMSPLRAGRRLLVLDLDYTLFDLSTVAETGAEVTRPHLHEFLARAYSANYDLAIWSATSMKWIHAKLKAMGVHNAGERYRISFCLDSVAMVTVTTDDGYTVKCKPLRVIWDKYEALNGRNTLIVDDIRHNFLLNPRNGVCIRPYTRARAPDDCELVHLADYLDHLDATRVVDLSTVNHRKWTHFRRHR